MNENLHPGGHFKRACRKYGSDDLAAFLLDFLLKGLQALACRQKVVHDDDFPVFQIPGQLVIPFQLYIRPSFLQVQALPLSRIFQIGNAVGQVRALVPDVVRYAFEAFPVFPLCAAWHEQDDRFGIGGQQAYARTEEIHAVCLAVFEVEHILAGKTLLPVQVSLVAFGVVIMAEHATDAFLPEWLMRMSRRKLVRLHEGI